MNIRTQLAKRIEELGSEGIDLANKILGEDTTSWALGADYELVAPVVDIYRFIRASRQELNDRMERLKRYGRALGEFIEGEEYVHVEDVNRPYGSYIASWDDNKREWLLRWNKPGRPNNGEIAWFVSDSVYDEQGNHYSEDASAFMTLAEYKDLWNKEYGDSEPNLHSHPAKA